MATVTSFAFFNDFDGNNLLFVVWLFLIIVPIIGKFKGFGVEVGTPFEPLEGKVEELTAEFKATDVKNIANTDELEKKFYEIVQSKAVDSNVE